MTPEQRAAVLAGILTELQAEACRNGYEAAREQAAQVVEQKWHLAEIGVDGHLIAAAIRSMQQEQQP